MNLIFFIHKDVCYTNFDFKTNIAEKFMQENIQTVHTFNAFKARLKKASDYNEDIFIIFADSELRLKELSGLIDLLDGKRLVLILPDDEPATLSTAHLFFPRFIAFAKDKNTNLCDVLDKMMTQKNSIIKEGI